MDNKNGVEKIKLTNGETLEIHDRSRMVIENIWQISLVFIINIDLKQKKFNELKNITDEQIKDKFGNTIIYEVKHERNFIKDEQKNDTYNKIKDSFLNTNLKYLSHPDFAVKYSIKKYNEKKRY
ncbi:MAG: hypothetical protein KKD44_04515 [Proteobacteria bacterium]|nr:hypothetical protein [Pseudomonadota bacterium]